MSILISHSNALISAGLVATMQQLRDCEIQCNTEGDDIDFANRLDDIDLIIADSASLPRSTRSDPGAWPAPARARPQIVLLTASRDDAPGLQALPHGVSACLPYSCRQDDLLRTVCSLMGTMVLPRTLGDSHDANARRKRSTTPRGGIAPSALHRVREHIDQNLCEHIDVAQLAALTGLSACHFSRAFKQSVGVPPHRYVLSRRVQAAAALIRSTDRPMSDIALEVGFFDQSHFTRVFTAHMGESPRRFRYLHR
ncbi:AraC family transcriptional regulator [Variovorax sp. J31P207]|uniref:helix-turn-helix domain-containing protein n=1 Tax=Variovorax sp. J31P207 TaxID=3053510 RepID=UPI002576886C|nr:AraC family transcriptional regulator [Variovorax sp. J31P207]MDM0066292.1 AraC family transcriptional regulator [Variovorax sp. J31P207]